ncbi:hypothetical protein [Oricola thermophila]|uniref:DNA-binding protein n=1 Tax=Oricola thermophila TaxID=2742145 RepID=A0A6N1VCF9_9HYPH|nr:hypothetical protein [Oricola thermophila]QKV18686.1 hypothetical protein HTY61_09610 [Oricola thermophila]
MAERFDFELVFGLPEGEHDPFALSDAVFEAGYEDALVGTGNPRLLAVEIGTEGEDAEAAMIAAARAIIKKLPEGSELREARPDLVSQADVAEKLGVSRQSLQKRKMPLPVAGGLYRIDEVEACLLEAERSAQRKPRFDLGNARDWFRAGHAARRLNARIAMGMLDARTLEPVDPSTEGTASPVAAGG